ncbi:MAG: type II secretion system protein [Lachnospiraceae bacterium]|nr:type II secretion system protein [Lachnospiraceae bacterium]
MKKTNKGFSLVELIIVIAIMAILAGALAPALIKYINKSRLSTDIQTGQTIATAITTALSDETAYDDCTAVSSAKAVTTMAGNDFKDAVNETVNVDNVKVKAKKDMKGSALDSGFYYTVEPTANTCSVFMKTTGGSLLEVYPNVAEDLTKK